MGSEDADVMEEGGGGGASLFGGSSVTCSICFEAVMDDGSRSKAKLQCGHEFHLDCIGSAFNVKGMMQCPNCRKIEKGQWLYANGSRSYPEFSMDEWAHDEDLYDLSYSEMPFHWCPFGGLTRVPSSFEEGESPSTVYHDLFGHHTMFAEHTAASSATHSCPYVAYFQPLQPSSSNSNEGIADVPPTFNQHWSGLSGSIDISASHSFTAMDLNYQSWEHPTPSFSPNNNHFGGTDQASVSSGTLRSTRTDSDGQPRSGSFMHPVFISHGSGPRAGSSVVSPLVPPYPGSNSRSHERAPGLQAYRRQQQQQAASVPGMRGSSLFSNVRRSSGPRAPMVPVASSSERNNGVYMFPSSGSSSRNIPEADNFVRTHLYAWERDRFAPYPLIPVDRESSWWGPFHQSTGGGSDSSSRSNSFWHRQGSERTSQGPRSENPTFQASHAPGPMHRFI